MRVADVYLAEVIKALEVKKAKEIEKMTGGGLAGTVVIAEEKLKEKAGVYRSLTNGELRRVTLRDSKLRIDAFTRSNSELKPFSETQFNIAGQEGAVAEFGSTGGKAQLHLSRNDRKPETFGRVEAFEPGAGRLNEFAGNYYSEELDTTYRMSVEQGRLFVINSNNEKEPLTPTIRDSSRLFPARNSSSAATPPAKSPASPFTPGASATCGFQNRQ